MCRVYLRKFEPQDIANLYKYRNDVNIKRNLGGFSHGFSKKEMGDWLEYHNGNKNESIWAVVAKNKEECLGYVGFYDIDFRTRKAEFGILIGDESCRGNGYGKEVSEIVLEYGFYELNLHKVYLTVLEYNEVAIKLYEKLGFHKDGILIDEVFREGKYHNMLVMSILEQEYTCKK